MKPRFNTATTVTQKYYDGHEKQWLTVKTLTNREHEIAQLVVQGLTSADIAHKLGISHCTVEIHRANVFRKLGLLTQTKQLVRYMENKNRIDGGINQP
jgi:DNA-binding NarL/FixJ family response regulator